MVKYGGLRVCSCALKLFLRHFFVFRLFFLRPPAAPVLCVCVSCGGNSFFYTFMTPAKTIVQHKKGRLYVRSTTRPLPFSQPSQLSNQPHIRSCSLLATPPLPLTKTLPPSLFFFFPASLSSRYFDGNAHHLHCMHAPSLNLNAPPIVNRLFLCFFLFRFSFLFPSSLSFFNVLCFFSWGGTRDRDDRC